MSNGWVQTWWASDQIPWSLGSLSSTKTPSELNPTGAARWRAFQNLLRLIEQTSSPPVLACGRGGATLRTLNLIKNTGAAPVLAPGRGGNQARTLNLIKTVGKAPVLAPGQGGNFLRLLQLTQSATVTPPQNPTPFR